MHGKTYTIVLILIILEYIYIKKLSVSARHNNVLILIILEYIYMQNIYNWLADKAIVLILIILEYIYMSLGILYSP